MKNNCLKFDGVSGYGYLNRPLMPVNLNFSLCFAVKAPPQSDKTLLDGYTDSSMQPTGWIVQSGGSNLAFSANGTTIGGSQNFPNVLDNEWHFIAIAWDGSGFLNTWVDGVNGAPVDVSAVGPITWSPSNFYIGCRYREYPAPTRFQYFNGLVDDFRFWDDYVLTDANVAVITANKLGSKYIKPTLPSPLVAFNMDEGGVSPTTVDEQNGNVISLFGNYQWQAGGVPLSAPMTGLILADAVVASLNADPYNVDFTAVRKLWPFYDLKDLTTVRVSVVPRSVAITSATRSTSDYEYNIDVAIQKSLTSPNDDADAAYLTELAVAIAKSFRGRVYDNLGAVCFKQSIDPIYSVDHIAPPSVFTTVVTLTFKVIE